MAAIGEQVLNEILDLLNDRLPSIPTDDPTRPHLAVLAPALSAALGRPPARLAWPLDNAAADVLRHEQHARDGRQVAECWGRLADRIERDFPAAAPIEAP